MILFLKVGGVSEAPATTDTQTKSPLQEAGGGYTGTLHKLFPKKQIKVMATPQGCGRRLCRTSAGLSSLISHKNLLTYSGKQC